jgi:hypothetical protein
MALKILNPGVQPLGQFDGYDALTSTVSGIKGGEVATLVNYQFLVGTDKAAYDASGADGYVGTFNKVRPIVTTTLVSGTQLLGLTDDGTSGYGTLFGQLVGSIAGSVTSGAQMGPNTAAGSGKITFWDKPGLYAVTLDAVDTTSGTGLVTNNATLNVGDALYATSAGLLTPNASARFSGSNPVGRFVEFSTNGSLVTTPSYLVQTAPVVMTQAVFHFFKE